MVESFKLLKINFIQMNRAFFILLMVFTGSSLKAQTPQTLKSWLPEIPGWTLQEKVEVFHAENLYERINGAAESYFLYDFKEMTSLEYQKGDLYITLQVYRHGDPVNAFGIYASERPSEPVFVRVGTQGYHEPTLLNFFSGHLYVKMHTASEEPEVQSLMEKIALAFAGKMGDTPSFPPLLEGFPSEGKVSDSEQYIAKSFMGQSVLHSAYTATYLQGTDEYKLFLIDAGSEEEAKAMLSAYLTVAGQSVTEIPVSVVVKDPYNGEVPVLRKGRYLLGISNDYRIDIPGQAVLGRFEQRLREKGFIQ